MTIVYRALPALIKSTLLREYRSKTILFMMLLTIVSLFFINMLLKFFGSSSGVEETGDFNILSAYILSFFIIFMNWWCYLVTTIVGSNAYVGDQENGLISNILSFPITRETYLLGRIIGIFVLIVGLYLLAYGLAIATFSFHVKSLIIGPEIFYSLLYLSFTIFALIIFSSFAGLYIPRVIAVPLILIMNSIWGQIIASAEAIKKLEAHVYTFGDYLVSALAYVFPRIGIVGEISYSVLNKQEIAHNLFIEIPLFIIVSVVWFLLFTLIIKKRDF